MSRVFSSHTKDAVFLIAPCQEGERSMDSSTEGSVDSTYTRTGQEQLKRNGLMGDHVGVLIYDGCKELCYNDDLLNAVLLLGKETSSISCILFLMNFFVDICFD